MLDWIGASLSVIVIFAVLGLLLRRIHNGPRPPLAPAWWWRFLDDPLRRRLEVAGAAKLNPPDRNWILAREHEFELVTAPDELHLAAKCRPCLDEDKRLKNEALEAAREAEKKARAEFLAIARREGDAAGAWAAVQPPEITGRVSESFYAPTVDELREALGIEDR